MKWKVNKMSNIAAIQFCEFVNLDNELVPRKSTPIRYFGFRIFDNYDMGYSTIAASNEGMKRQIEGMKGETFFVKTIRLVKKYSNETIGSILDSVHENEKGMLINGNYHGWEEIKEAFDDD